MTESRTVYATIVTVDDLCHYCGRSLPGHGYRCGWCGAPDLRPGPTPSPGVMACSVTCRYCGVRQFPLASCVACGAPLPPPGVDAVQHLRASDDRLGQAFLDALEPGGGVPTN